MYARPIVYASMSLTSSQNPLLKKVRSAVEFGKPTEEGLVAAEGPHLLAEALTGCWQVARVFYASEAKDRHASLLSKAGELDVELIEVNGQAFKSIRHTEHTQGIVTLLLPREFGWRDLLSGSGPLVILDGIQDPGNAGSILRSIEAFSGAGVALTRGCVRISNGKLLRAAAGSVFRLPFLENLSVDEVIDQVAGAGRKLFSLNSHAGVPINEALFEGPVALVVGSEGGGITAEFDSASTAISIQTRKVESLNASIACSIALYEIDQQRAARAEAGG